MYIYTYTYTLYVHTCVYMHITLERCTAIATSFPNIEKATVCKEGVSFKGKLIFLYPLVPLNISKFFFKVYLFLRQCERQSTSSGAVGGGGGWCRQRETQNLNQAPGSELSAQCLTWGLNSVTHKPWDHDLSRDRTLNRLSHSGALATLWIFLMYMY